MTDWAPVIGGIVIIAIAFGILRFAPRSAWAQELRRSYGIRPTGARGNRTRHDYRRSAGLAAAGAVVLYATASVAESYVLRAPSNIELGAIAMAYEFVGLLLSLMAGVSALHSLWRSIRWRVELPDTPEHRRGLADAIDHLLDGRVSPEERRDYLDVVYVQPQLEQIRRASLKLAKQHQTGVPEDYREQIKRWTAGIRASATPRE
ncbi:MAG: hypothetical protein ACREPM_14030 [Gemmatimonadaceae bacterium]